VPFISFVQQLDRNMPVELLVLREVNNSHPALAQPPNYLVVADTLAVRQEREFFGFLMTYVFERRFVHEAIGTAERREKRFDLSTNFFIPITSFGKKCSAFFRFPPDRSIDYLFNS
jgi:hypothetical protein